MECEGIHDHLLHYPQTTKERKQIKFIQSLTNWSEDQSLEFVRIYYWHISSEGGADRVLKRLGLI